MGSEMCIRDSIVAMYQWWNVGPIDNAWLAALAISAKAEVPPPFSA